MYAEFIKSGYLWGVEWDQEEERGALTFHFTYGLGQKFFFPSMSIDILCKLKSRCVQN